MKIRAVALGLAMSISLAKAYTGDLTYYTPNEGSCGHTNTNGDAIVALSHLIMSPANPSNPNFNPYCGKQISIHNPTTGTDTIATVADTCDGCAYDNIDVPPDLFYTIAPNGNGRVPGIQWTPIGWTVAGGSGESESATTQSSVSSVAAVLPSTALPTISLQEKLAAAVPSAAVATALSESSSTPDAPSSASAVATSVAPSAATPSNAQTASCTIPGETVCSADGTQIGTCTTELTVQFGPVAPGTKCVGGWMVMANSRLRSRRG
ncbi:MAG: hypothetical protein Q9175_006645 [Cornicularia normoerica]